MWGRPVYCGRQASAFLLSFLITLDCRADVLETILLRVMSRPPSLFVPMSTEGRQHLTLQSLFRQQNDGAAFISCNMLANWKTQPKII